MTHHILAHCDQSRSARVVRRWPLFYNAGADPSLDRPAHVRAGSGLAFIGGRLAAIQDDAHFLAVIEPFARSVEAITLPHGPESLRQFDDFRGNKRWKSDLEACFTVIEEGRPVLVALGSGSSAWREQALLIQWPPNDARDIRVCRASGFYARLRLHEDFSGSELNVEGAVHLDGGSLRLFQRGNGAPRAGIRPVNATCEVSWPALRAHLRDPTMPAPSPRNITQYDLGSLDGVRLTFTDAARRGDRVFFTATAEESPDATRDGPVAGSALGQIMADGSAVLAIFEDAGGNRLRAKVEGLSFEPATDDKAWILIDRDDPRAPSELCEVELRGDWGGNLRPELD